MASELAVFVHSLLRGGRCEVRVANPVDITADEVGDLEEWFRIIIASLRRRVAEPRPDPQPESADG